MTSAAFASVDDYIDAQPKFAQETLRCVRKTIRAALPRADEVISYNMPTYKINGRTIVQFAGWSGHYALYAASAPIVQEFKNDLQSYKVNKGTIQFPLDQPVPEKLIERIAKFRAKLAGADERI